MAYRLGFDDPVAVTGFDPQTNKIVVIKDGSWIVGFGYVWFQPLPNPVRKAGHHLIGDVWPANACIRFIGLMGLDHGITAYAYVGNGKG